LAPHSRRTAREQAAWLRPNIGCSVGFEIHPRGQRGRQGERRSRLPTRCRRKERPCQAPHWPNGRLRLAHAASRFAERSTGLQRGFSADPWGRGRSGRRARGWVRLRDRPFRRPFSLSSRWSAERPFGGEASGRLGIPSRKGIAAESTPRAGEY
jgi:hypothetical protein